MTCPYRKRTREKKIKEKFVVQTQGVYLQHKVLTKSFRVLDFIFLRMTSQNKNNRTKKKAMAQCFHLLRHAISTRKTKQRIVIECSQPQN